MLIYKDASYPISDRVEDLLGHLSFEQKIDQVTCLVTISEDLPDFKRHIPNGIGNVGAFTVARNVETIAEYSRALQEHLVENTEWGIPALIHCEASAGAQFTAADVFPSPIAQASTFDPALIGDMADLIREQMLAVGFRQALSPVLDVCRDPRWGRMTETYGEDPTLIAAMAGAFVSGLQGPDPAKGLLATAKHFIGHGSTEGGLNMGRSVITGRELREVHCKPFQAVISEENLRSVMNSYCSYDGKPVVSSRALLTDLLRGELGFSGFVVSDYISVDRIVDPFRAAENFTDAGVQAMTAGLDVELPRPKGFSYDLKAAVDDGRLNIETVDEAVRRVLTAKMELGLFENPYPDDAKIKKIFGSGNARALNEKIALESLTLLKNRNGTLPLDRGASARIAVLGPHGDSLRSYFGTFSQPAVIDMTLSREEDGQEFEEEGLIVYDIAQRYAGQMRESSPRVEKILRADYPGSMTLVQAIREISPESRVDFAKGIDAAGHDIGGMEQALQAAAEADIIILTLGGKNGWGVTSTVGEGVDSTDIGLPGMQEEFARRVRALGKRTVVVHFDGRPLSSEYVSAHFDAVLEAWQPGEFGGQALAKVLFGEADPSGRLPVTAARNAGQIPVHSGLHRGSGFVGAGHTGMIRNPRGYINDTAFPLYPFGHGLSYSRFRYSELRAEKDVVGPKETLILSLSVTNIGDRDGDEVVQLYYSDECSSMVRPEMEMAGFRRVSLDAGQTRMVRFYVEVSQLAFLDENMEWIVEKGAFRFLAGASSADIRSEHRIIVTDSASINPRTRGFYAYSEVD